MSRLPLYGRQGKFTFRLLAITLFGQSIILSFFALVARGNAIAAGRPQEGYIRVFCHQFTNFLAPTGAADRERAS